MNESELRDRLGELVADQPRTRYAGAEALHRGRHRVRVRRIAASVGGAALATAVVLGAWALVPGDPAARGSAGFASGVTPELTDAEIVQRCMRVDNGGLDPEQFGPRSQVLLSEATGSRISAVILADRAEVWAECGLRDESVEASNGYTNTYPLAAASASSRRGLERNSMDLGVDTLGYVDRFPADVARVELTFSDGSVMSAPAVDGFVVFQREAESTIPDDGGPSIALYGADGELLADESMAPGDSSLPLEYRTLIPAPGPVNDAD